MPYMNRNNYFLYLDYIKDQWFWYIKHFPGGRANLQRIVDTGKRGYDSRDEAMRDGMERFREISLTPSR